jgi:hypothetical protein
MILYSWCPLGNDNGLLRLMTRVYSLSILFSIARKASAFAALTDDQFIDENPYVFAAHVSNEW